MSRVLLLLALAPWWASAATIEVRPGDSLQGAHDVAEPGDTLRIVGEHSQQKVDIRKDRITVECAIDAVLNGERNRDSAIVVLGDNVTVIGCRIANYTASGVRVKDAAHFVVEDNTIGPIGSERGCGPDVPGNCVGFGGIHVTDSTDGIVRYNHMSGIRNHDDDAGKVHCIYASRVRRVDFESNTCKASTGDQYKFRSAFKTTWTRNFCAKGPLCFVSGVPDRLADEEPRSKDNQLWLNQGYDMDGFVECRGEGQGDDSRRNCVKYSVIVNDEKHWQVTKLDVSSPDEPELDPKRPLKNCPSGKTVKNLNGEGDCNRCFPRTRDKNRCIEQCLPLGGRGISGERHDCARSLF